ncbi:MAG: PqqD family protein [Clostridia bacterium]|nr:PqqD family protein [Clostridia bacterium]
MKLKGDFVVRSVMDNNVVIPIGQTALKIKGMILLNDVSMVIWECLLNKCDVETIVSAVTDKFEVSDAEARTDIIEFLDLLRKAQLLDE